MEEEDAASHISTVAGPDDLHRDIEILRAQTDRVLEAEAIDKATSLTILKLMHTAEVILRREAHEIAILKMNAQFASTLEDFRGAIRSLQADVEALKAAMPKRR